MYKKIILFISFLIVNLCFSQEKIKLIDVDEIKTLANNYGQEGDYEHTLETLNKINKNDSTYCSNLLSKSYYLIQLKKYSEAILLTDEGLQNKCGDLDVYFHINKTVSYINHEKFEDALKSVNEGLESFPYNYKLWYNKGILFEKLNEINDAVIAYQNSILYNSTYGNAHLNLGNICYKQEKLAQALMCFNMYLLLNPNGKGSFSVLKSLNSIIGASNINTSNPDIVLSIDDESFEDIDLVLDQRIALNENYTIDNKIKISLVKQNHALLEQLKDFNANGGFWDTKYVPFYKWVINNNYFDDFIYTITSSIENEEYKKVINKNKDKINSFIDASGQQWENILKENNVIELEENKKTFYYVESSIRGFGNTKNNNVIGDWIFINESGRISGKGNFDNDSNRDGSWSWYYSEGNIKETALYKNGKLQGENIHYFENGKIYIQRIFLNDELDGEFLVFNNKGALTQKKYFKADLLEGPYKSYFNVGNELVEFDIPYRNNLMEDNFIEYYANGDVFLECNYNQGKKNGLEKKYHVNKKLYSEISYTNGELNGSYKVYHLNGNLMEIGQCVDGLFIGSWKTFYKNGITESEFKYTNGNLDGLYKYFDKDGKINYEFIYRKGELISYKFFNKQGHVLKEEKKKGGEFFYTGYSPNGNITVEGLYDVKGGKKGEWKYYSTNGVLIGKGSYIENKTNGEYITYYKNGKKESEAFYINDVLDGYYVEYYNKGNIKIQGWYKNGLEYGEWRNYYIDGTLNNISFFHKGNLHGNQNFFASNGNIYNISKYVFGDLKLDTFYNKDGEIHEIIKYENEKNKYTISFKHINNKIDTEIEYTNEMKHGKYTNFNFYGTKKITGEYLNGNQHGKWKWFHDNGKLENISNFINGNLNGELINYYDSGEIEDQYLYNYGFLNGKSKSYFKNGKIFSTTDFDDSEIHGRKEFYTENGHLQIIRFYDYGKLIGFSYLGKNSLEEPMKEIINETGKIVAYFDNGKISREMEYKDGNLVNNYKSYYYSGQLEGENNFINGEYNGTDFNYYQNGNIKKEKEYLEGNLHGIAKEYYESGVLKEEKHYQNNIKNGDSNYYNDKGKLVKIEQYFNGNIYNIKIY